MSSGPSIPSPIPKLTDITSNSSTWFGQWVQTNKWYLGLWPVLPTRPRFGGWVGCLGDIAHVQKPTHDTCNFKLNIYHVQLLHLVRSMIPDQQAILGLCPVSKTRPRLGGWVGYFGDRVQFHWFSHPKSNLKSNIHHFQLLHLVWSMIPDQQVILGFMTSFTNKAEIRWMSRMFRT